MTVNIVPVFDPSAETWADLYRIEKASREKEAIKYGKEVSMIPESEYILNLSRNYHGRHKLMFEAVLREGGKRVGFALATTEKGAAKLCKLFVDPEIEVPTNSKGMNLEMCMIREIEKSLSLDAHVIKTPKFRSTEFFESIGYEIQCEGLAEYAVKEIKKIENGVIPVFKCTYEMWQGIWDSYNIAKIYPEDNNLKDAIYKYYQKVSCLIKDHVTTNHLPAFVHIHKFRIDAVTLFYLENNTCNIKDFIVKPVGEKNNKKWLGSTYKPLANELRSYAKANNASNIIMLNEDRFTYRQLKCLYKVGFVK